MASATASSHYQHKTGRLEQLRIACSTLPDTVERGRVRVKVHSIGLNFADVFAILGLYSATPKTPFIPGLEYSGEVVRVPEGGAARFKVGDRVTGVTRFGGYTSQMDAEEEYVEMLPEGWSFEEGAAFPVQALTAFYGLMELGNAKSGQVALIHSAAGGVGLFALDILDHIGAKSICTVSTEKKKEFLLERCSFLQPGQVIVRTGGSAFAAQLSEAMELLYPGNARLDLVFDSLGGEYFDIGYKMMSRGGRLVLFGAGSMMPHGNLGLTNILNVGNLARKWLARSKIDPYQMITENKSIMGFNLIWMYDKKEMMKEMAVRLQELNLRKPHVGHRFDFDKMQDAVAFLQSGQNVGKVVVNVNHEQQD